jgi:hypothetical protein
MIKNRERFLLPAIFLAGSFLCLVLTLLLTNPLKNLSYTIVLFSALLIFLISLGHIFYYLKAEYINTRSRYRIYIFSFLVVIALMFRSAQSLNFTDLIILLLIGFGLAFYSTKRTS